MSKRFAQKPVRRARSIKPMNSDESLLFDVARKRDRQAFEALFKKYRRPAYQLACFLTRNADEAEEATQEAMLGMWQSASTFKGGNPRGWIMRIVANHSLKAINRKRNTLNLEDGVRQSPSAKSPVQETFEDAELTHRLRSLVEGLPPQERRIVALYYGCNCSQDEIARILSIPQRTISKRLESILGSLRRRFATAGFSAKALCSESFILVLDLGSKPAFSLRDLATGVARQKAQASPWPSFAPEGKRSLPFAGVACGLLLMGAVTTWALTRTGPPQPKPSDTLANKAKRASNEVICHWNFDDGSLPKDLLPIRGHWQRKKKGGLKDSGCLEIIPTYQEQRSDEIISYSKSGRPLFQGPTQSEAEIRIPMQHLPVRISFKMGMLPHKIRSSTILLIPGWKEVSTIGLLQGFQSISPGAYKQWYHREIFVTDSWIDLWRDGERQSLILTTPQPGAPLCLYVRGPLKIDEFAIHRIPASEVPDIRQAVRIWTSKHGKVRMARFPVRR